MTFKTFFGHDLDYSKAATMLSVHHVLLLFFGLVTIFMTLRYAQTIHQIYDTKFRMILIGFLVFLEITYHIHNWTYPRFSMPLHISSFAVLLNIALLYTKSQKVFEYAFFFGLGAGLIALAFPNSLGYTYLNFRYYHFIVIHCLIMVGPLYFYKAEGYRVDYPTLIKVFKSVIAVGLMIYGFNRLFDQNYWFITEIPTNVSSVFTNYYAYIITYIIAVFTTMNLLYFTTHKRHRQSSRGK